MQIIPAILTSDPLELDAHLKKLRNSGQYERVQVDFIDAEFANNETIHPVQSDLIPFLPLKFDAHLMVRGDNVLFWGKECEKMGFERVYYQVESMLKPDQEYLALDLGSPIEKLGKLNSLKGIIVMSVKAGYAGQDFDPAAVDIVRQLSDLRTKHGYQFEICVDGGVEKEHLQILEQVGADSVAVGVKRVMDWNK